MKTPFSSVLSWLSVYILPGERGVLGRLGSGRLSFGGEGYLVTKGENSRRGRLNLSFPDSRL